MKTYTVVSISTRGKKWESAPFRSRRDAENLASQPFLELIIGMAHVPLSVTVQEHDTPGLRGFWRWVCAL